MASPLSKAAAMAAPTATMNILSTMQQAAIEKADRIALIQDTTAEKLETAVEKVRAQSPEGLKKAKANPKKKIQERFRAKAQKTEGDEESHAEKRAEKFAGRSAGELKKQLLLNLRREILDKEPSKEELLKLVEERHGEPHFVDEVLEFLEKTTTGAANEQIHQAREEYQQEHSRQISYGRSMGAVARRLSLDGRGDVGAIRNQLDIIMASEMSPQDILVEVFKVHHSSQAAVDQLKLILHYAGANFKKPNEEIAYLQNLGQAVRSLQSGLSAVKLFEKLLERGVKEARHIDTSSGVG